MFWCMIALADLTKAPLRPKRRGWKCAEARKSKNEAKLNAEAKGVPDQNLLRRSTRFVWRVAS